MGYILNAHCRICDYKTDIWFGGGRFNYQTNNPVPAINVHTGKLESVNYITDDKNPNYLFYTDNDLKGDNGKNNVFQNFDLFLNQSNNYCPNCKAFTFDFHMHILY
ncbi:hypothetical protein ACFS5J_06735 [Flavobacterium chuncheonense]|uniref:Uncharacterized protein n=1 Tax=Flavobacterium chuncheonense TaxID=2026653 RepID=A0ABW5YKU0_9FLAO